MPLDDLDQDTDRFEFDLERSRRIAELCKEYCVVDQECCDAVDLANLFDDNPALDEAHDRLDQVEEELTRLLLEKRGGKPKPVADVETLRLHIEERLALLETRLTNSIDRTKWSLIDRIHFTSTWVPLLVGWSVLRELWSLLPWEIRFRRKQHLAPSGARPGAAVLAAGEAALPCKAETPAQQPSAIRSTAPPSPTDEERGASSLDPFV